MIRTPDSPPVVERAAKRSAPRTRAASVVDARTYTEAHLPPMPVDPDYDDGYRCHEHGLNHDCPVSD